jgi:hypothetical protein
LYLSRILAQRMGGRLSFANNPDRGLRAELALHGRLA